jgi:CO dehydrogenase maturation factor
MPITIAITGKGGTGKTLLAALLVRALTENGHEPVLAVDADSAVSLPCALGLPVNRTVSDLRISIAEDPAFRKQMMERHVRDVIGEIVTRGPGFDLLVMGRSEGPGCYCAVNDLLRYGIEALVSRYRVVVIDGEAGPEQVNRRVLSGIDTLLVVTDTSARSARTAELIRGIAAGMAPSRVGVVVNRLRGGEVEAQGVAVRAGISLLGWIPEDDLVRTFDAEDRPLIGLPESAPCVAAARAVLRRLVVR